MSPKIMAGLIQHNNKYIWESEKANKYQNGSYGEIEQNNTSAVPTAD